MNDINELLVFNNIKRMDIFESILNKNENEIKSKLINFALKEKLEGNLIKKYIIYTLLYNENPYTLAIELNKNVIVEDIFLNDLKLFYEIYNDKNLYYNEIVDFKFNYNNKSNISLIIDNLYNEILDFDSFKNVIINFYKTYGVGIMAIYKAFRVEDGSLKPIKNTLNVTFNDLIGYDYQKELLKDNTINFINNKPANNVLLYGDSGTGKSTSIKALLNEYFNLGLRIIEVYKHQMNEISKIINSLKERPFKYIIFMDDLSFDENEVEYKYLKSVIEGGIEPKPDNVLIYATSNRRHLIKETFQDNGTIFDDLHRSETQAEKLSLAYRFGLQIFYSNLSREEFKNMVIALAYMNNIKMDEELLIKEASKWELQYGSLSGRCAKQFISYLVNRNINND